MLAARVARLVISFARAIASHRGWHVAAAGFVGSRVRIESIRGRHIVNARLEFVRSALSAALAVAAAGILHLPATATAAPALVAASAVTAVAPALAEAPYYLVMLREPSLGSYAGDKPGLAQPPRIASRANRVDVNSPAAAAYVQYLQNRQQQFLQSVSQAIGRTPVVMASFQHAFNGMALKVSLAEAEAIQRMPDVALVDAGRNEVMDTDAGPTFIGAPGIWNGTATGGLPATRGEGVVYAAIDSGINFLSPSFAATGPDAYVHVNPYGSGNFVGTCATGGIDAGSCNNKLIGAYDFVFAVCSDPSNPCGAPGAWLDEASATDSNGHGTHTASTAAGNAVSGTLFGGAGGASVPISGVANHANLIAYDVCYTRVSDGNGLCPGVALVNAVNQAVADGVVDVIGYSISGGNSPWTDAVSQAFLGAVDAGIIVSASGGNTGPTAGSVGHREPWTITVAASTHNRDFFANPLSIVGPGTPPANVQNRNSRQGAGPFLAASQTGVPIALPTDPLGCSAVPAGTYTGLVLVRRGTCSFTIKINNAQAGGATGVIISQNVASPTTIAMGTTGALLPAAMISQADGAAIEAFITANPGATADWLVSPVTPVAGQGDVMAAFSSRGPSNIDALKPDVTGPGVAILAAYAGAANATAFIQGTSMSQPHNAGSAMLLRALHPSWTPMEIKSALMLTARTQGIVDENLTTPSDAFDRGAGRLNLTQAGVSGLVLNETGIRFSQANPAATPAGDPTTLNLPSYQIGSCAATCSFTRRVRSTLSTPQTWNASVVGPAGLVATVTPSTFTILPGQTQQITVNLDVTALTPAVYAFAELRLAPPPTTTTFSASPAVAIPDNVYVGGFGAPTMACSTINTDALPVGSIVSSAQITTGLTHTWAGDLVAKLRTPSGTTMGVFSRPGVTETADDGNDTAGFGDSSNLAAANVLTFRDGGAFSAEIMGSTIATGGIICAPPAGGDGRCDYFPFRGAVAGPPNAFADLAGQSARGDWTLCVGDAGTGDTGSVGTWSLTIGTPSSSGLHMPLAIRPAIPPTPPAITVTPASLAITLAPDVPGSQTFDIGNTGETALNWTIDEASPPAVVLELPEEVPAEKVEANRVAGSTTRLVAQAGGPVVPRYLEADSTSSVRGGAVTLSVDDGSAENGIGLTGGSQIIWFNRFTPAPATYPFSLTQIQALFRATDGIVAGQIVDFHVFTDADGNPANGAVLVGSLLNQAIPALETFQTYNLAAPLVLSGPGDVLIAVVNRTAGVTAGTFPAAIDQTASQQRSWVGEYGGAVPNPPTLPATGLYGEIGALSAALAGNWMVRGLGFQGTPTACTAPADVPWLSVTPTSGTTAPAGTSTVTVNYNPTGLVPAVYSALLCIDSNDPVNATVELPVTMTVVIPVDALFTDGFEDPPPPP